MTEKHKLNVPETMTEVLDVSDEEGESCCTLRLANINRQHSPQMERDTLVVFKAQTVLHAFVLLLRNSLRSLSGISRL